MARDPIGTVGRSSAPGPYEKRLAQTHRKLREALDRLVQGASDPALRSERDRFSVARLAREAGVARNAIYTNHRAIIDALREAERQQVVPSKLESWQDKLAQQRAVIESLKTQQRLLATENAGLLKRAIDAEATAARHQRQNTRLIAQMKPKLLTTPRAK